MAKKKSPYNIRKLELLVKAMRAGLIKLQGVSSLTVLGELYATLADLDKKLATYDAAFDSADSLHQQAAAADQQLEAMAPEMGKFMGALVRAFKAALGNHSPTLKTVGITPDKMPEQLTVDQKAAKVEKGLATRGVRHTTGEKAKAKIHGQVPPAGTPPAQTPPAEH